MATFTGTAEDDLITPGAVSPGVTSDGGATPDGAPDLIDGGAGDDTIDGGGGNRDIVDGGAGSDLIINSEGTLAFGGEGADSLVGAFNDVQIAGEGDDVLTVGNSTRAFGEAGADTFIIPSEVNGADMSGGDGADLFVASSGNFVIRGDAGDDVVVWAVAEPSFSDSLIDGGDGRDVFTVIAPRDDTGSEIRLGDEEGFDLVRVVRGASDSRLYAQNMERINVKAGRGADTIVVADQTGLGAEDIGLDLGAGLEGGPDGQGDALTIAGTGGADDVTVDAASGVLVVDGLAAELSVSNVDHSAAATDNVLIAAGDGDDTIDVSGAAAALSGVISVDGGAGSDAVRVATAIAAQALVVGADGDHATVRVGATQAADVTNVETLRLSPLAGLNTVTVQDLAGTGVEAVNIDFSGATAGQPDGIADRAIVTGADAADQVAITQGADGRSVQIAVAGGATTTVVSLDNADQLIIDGGAGGDSLVGGGPASVAQIIVNGGDGADLLVGGSGTVSLFGGAGDDVLRAGAGRSLQNGGSGDDVLFNAEGSIGQGDAGDDSISGAVNDVIQGGEGDDVIRLGSSSQASGDAGADTFLAAAGAANGSVSDGGEGDDVFVGAGGNLVFRGGVGDDAMAWNLGADISSNSVLEGGGDADSLTITGPQDASPWTITAGNNGTGFELVNLAHAGQTARVFTQSTESLAFGGGQGADTILVTDQTGLGVERMDIDLGAAAAGGPDGRRDSLAFQTSDGADTVVVATVDGELVVAAVAAATVHNLDHGGSVSDSVLVATGAGDDFIKMFGLNDASIGGVVTVDTGAGDDVVIGGEAGFTLLFHAGDLSRDRLDFFRGSGTGGSDQIRLLGGPDHSFADLVANGHIGEVGADVVITDGAGTFLTLTDTAFASLTASDFLFG